MKNKKYKLYGLYSLSDLRIRYIGITSQNINVRLKQHLYSKNKNTYKINWIKSINKNIGIKIIKSNLSFECARQLELDMISKYKYSHSLVNLTDRGMCGDLRVLKKDYCDKISNTLKNKYKQGILKPIGSKKVYVYNNNGKFIKEFENGKQCSKELKIPYSKIGNICNKNGFYKTYTFSRNKELPLQNYIKCYDIKTCKLYLFFKKEELTNFLKLNNTTYNKYYNTDYFFKYRYNIRTDNSLPPLYSKLIEYDNKFYTSLTTLIKENNDKIKFTWYSEIRKCLNNNIPFIKNNIYIANKSCARYKLGELRETL